ncbi:phospholipid transport system substrate-binding protein [Gemmobacter caeni]|uniref:Phospholipid transport system substrate-binding protein n=1 Tax=Gemmobacter caeni TaxID=589035 RepID=A0A2T6APP3_9RHOB|nr:ABC transporter substrate-binding protein [Gemmobacter caeni]PTX45785.1 phospholipid transport system substrate-binding protein [Gemmobacter caeni]TWI94090.1 phospholipid transport system substrate-binding protein [Gemmobacter caeni]
MAHPVLNRRAFAATALAGAALVTVPGAALALDLNSARALIDRAIADVNKVINSGKPEAAMFKDFEAIFARYADVNAIARSALGPAARSASPAQMKAFTRAYQGYIGRKYGRRFREFIGGTIEVVDAKPLKSYFEVISVARLRGEAPFDLRWHVSNKSGKDLFFNIIIEGVNMLASEREEIGAMLKRRKGDIDGLIGDLQAA